MSLAKAQLSISDKLHIDQMCLSFEAALKQRAAPAIEDYVKEVAEPVRSELLRELLLLELDYRVRRGELPGPQEYCRLLPDDTSVIETAFRAARRAASSAQLVAPASSASPESEPVSPPNLSGYVRMLEQPTAPAADSIPGYSIIREIHRGGQGVVYQAVQKTTRRKVAIKVMREGPFASKHDKARFEREVQVLGALKHPNIVAIHESGTVGGSFYFVMEYVSGQPLDVYMAAGHHSVRETLALFQKICEAVNAAHLRGVIHRDLKPGNIRIDLEGEPQILDFGLAKVAAGEIAGDSQIMTVTGQFVGSLPWASPEQAEGIPGKMDIRTDVYSLGVIVYQMLTGKFPYDVVGGFREVLDRIRTAPPARPRMLRADIDDEVETIVLKALAKERERRYQSAGELGRDITHYLAGEPIEAKRDSAWYILRKNLRRYRLAVAIGSSFISFLSVMLVLALVLWNRAAYERDRALSAEQTANEQRVAAVDARGAEEQQRELAQRKAQEAQAERARADERAELARRTLYVNQISLAERNYRVSPAQMKTVLEQCPSDLRGWEWDRLHWLSDTSLFTLRGHKKAVTVAAFRPDGGRLLSASLDGTLKLWNPATGREIVTLTGHTDEVHDASFSPDGRWIVSGSRDKTIRLWDAETGACLSTIMAHDYGVAAVAFSPDGRQIASGGEAERVQIGPDRRAGTTPGRPGSVKLWDVTSGRNLLTVEAAPREGIYFVTYAPDGRRLVVGGTPLNLEVLAGALRIRSVPFPVGVSADHKRLARLGVPTSGVRFMAVRDETTGKEIVTALGSADLAAPDVKVCDTSSDQELLALRGQFDVVSAVAFSRDNQRILTAGQDRRLRLWNAETAGQMAMYSGHSGAVLSLAFSPDGRRFASASEDATLKIWDAGTRPALDLQGHTDLVRTLAFSPDGSRLLSGSWDMTLKLWDVVTGEELVTFAGHTGLIAAVAFQADGARIASASEDKTVRIWNVGTGRADLVLRGHEQYVRSVAFSPDGKRIISGSREGSVKLWDAITGELIMTRDGATGWDLHAGFSPNGGRFFSAGDVFKLWDAVTGDPVAIPTRSENADVLAVSPDLKQILLRFWKEPVLVVWNVASGRELARYRGHVDVARAAAFSPDGTRIASAGQDQTVSLWNAGTGNQLLTLDEHAAQVNALAFSPDGQRIAAAGQTIKVWETRPPPGGFAVREAVSLAGPLVERLFRQVWFKRAVVEHLRADGSLDEPLRSTAVRLALRHGETAIIELAKESPKGASRVVAEVRSMHDEEFGLRDSGLYAEYLILAGEERRAIELLRRVGPDTANPDSCLVLGRALLACGLKSEARAAFEKVIADLPRWSPTPPAKAYISHWTAAYFLDLVTAEQFARQYRDHPALKAKYACWPWFYIGQRLESESKRGEAVAAYRKSVELGQMPDAYHVRNWAAYRLHVLTGEPLEPANGGATSQPATQTSKLPSG